MKSGWWLGVVALLGTSLAPAAAVLAQGNPPQVRVTLSPDMVKLGEPVRYRVELIGGLSPWAPVEWFAPDTNSAFTWGTLRHGVTKGKLDHRPRFGDAARTPRIDAGTPDTSWAEVPLQVFTLGVVPIAGIRFHYVPSIAGATPLFGQAPTARLVVLPTLSMRDTSATLHPVRGPLAAPWWERVPWVWVAAILAALALVVWLVRALKRRRPAARPAVPAAVPLAPAEAALAALAQLRALDLPGQQRFAEHAFQLGQILRHYLEALWPTARPGDTTPELVSHLGEAGLSGEDVQRLAALLRVWDRVKFAREPFTADEAARSESSVEAFVHRTARPISKEAA